MLKQRKMKKWLPSGEAEFRNTLWLGSWDQRSQKTFEIMIEDVIDS